MYRLHTKAALLLGAIIIFAATAQLQAQGFYFKEGLGYAFPMPGSAKDQLGNILNGSMVAGQAGNSYKVKNASFASGVHDVIGAGYMFTKNIGVELNADVLLAGKKYDFTELGITSNNMQANLTFTRQSNAYVAFMPALVIQTAGSTVIGYMHMGLLLPVATSIERHDVYYYNNGQVDDNYWKDKNSFSVGFSGATGIKYNCSPDFTLWAEVSLQYLSLSRKESDLAGFSVNGQSYNVAQLTGGVKTVYYSKNTTTSANGAYQEAFAQPYNSIGITAGVSLNLQQHNSVKKGKQAETRGHSF